MFVGMNYIRCGDGGKAARQLRLVHQLRWNGKFLRYLGRGRLVKKLKPTQDSLMKRWYRDFNYFLIDNSQRVWVMALWIGIMASLFAYKLIRHTNATRKHMIVFARSYRTLHRRKVDRAFRSSIKTVKILKVVVYPENVITLHMSKANIQKGHLNL